ncbi:hypothetical protein AB0I77_46520 [Streptomyces sp. NPDC050619]|uniref:hypothetical protein n=1 Tax=Streptomyces sp. NPDC050619 TaxID=3157214 RepID=UPI0034477C6D
MPSAEDWAGLTVSPDKRRLFAEDLYLRATWADLTEIAPGREVATLLPTALLSFKCDGVIGRRMRPTLDYLADAGFRVVDVRTVRHNRHSIREIWRYNWHLYPVDRLSLMSAMHTANDTALLLLHDERYDGRVPGSVRLASLKGSVSARKADPRHLRTVLRPPNMVINFVHVADEPADLLREIGIFLSFDERRSALAGLGGDAVPERVRAVVDDLESRYPERDLSLTNALERLAASGRFDGRAMDRLRAVIDDPGDALSWSELRSLAVPDWSGIDEWDLITIASFVLPEARTGISDPLPFVPVADAPSAPGMA